MDAQSIPIESNDGPAAALSILYEANDLLNILRDRGEADMESSDWTLTQEIKRRMDSAIAYLDHHVPTEAEKTESPEPAMNDKAIAANAVPLINDLQIRLEEIAGVASITAETCEDMPFNGVMCVIEREIQAVRDGLSDVIGAFNGGAA